MKNKYKREITGSIAEGFTCSAIVDVYDVLKAFDVRCPALQHLIKKALCAGLRGHKNASQDLDDIIASALRAKELSDYGVNDEQEKSISGNVDRHK